MRITHVVTALLSAGLAPASAMSFFSAGAKQESLRGSGTKIPGESPLELCDKSHENDTLHIKSVDLTPNPPLAGRDLVINAVGTVGERIEEGAYVILTVKYGLIRLIMTKADLCEQIQNVDLECPLEEGSMTITKVVSLPSEIPPGKYTVIADVYNKDDTPITCLTATVVFNPGEKFLNLEL